MHRQFADNVALEPHICGMVLLSHMQVMAKGLKGQPSLEAHGQQGPPKASAFTWRPR